MNSSLVLCCSVRDAVICWFCSTWLDIKCRTNNMSIADAVSRIEIRGEYNFIGATIPWRVALQPLLVYYYLTSPGVMNTQIEISPVIIPNPIVDRRLFDRPSVHISITLAVLYHAQAILPGFSSGVERILWTLTIFSGI